jgi:hypothetical protein
MFLGLSVFPILSMLPILSLSLLLLLRCRRSESTFFSPVLTVGELITPTGLRICTGRAWWWCCCDMMRPKSETLCVGVRLRNCAILEGEEWSSFISGSSCTWQTKQFYRISAAFYISNNKRSNRRPKSHQFWMFNVWYFPAE